MEESEKKDEGYVEQPIAEAKAHPAVLIVASIIGIALAIAAIVIWALTKESLGFLVGLILMLLGVLIFYIGILLYAQKAYLFEDKVEIYYLWRHFTLRIRDITSVGSGFLGYLKIGTSSYHWRFFLFMSGTYLFYDTLNNVLEERDRK